MPKKLTFERLVKRIDLRIRQNKSQIIAYTKELPTCVNQSTKKSIKHLRFNRQHENRLLKRLLIGLEISK